jgi:hypothetical protein
MGKKIHSIQIQQEQTEETEIEKPPFSLFSPVKILFNRRAESAGKNLELFEFFVVHPKFSGSRGSPQSGTSLHQGYGLAGRPSPHQVEPVASVYDLRWHSAATSRPPRPAVLPIDFFAFKIVNYYDKRSV